MVSYEEYKELKKGVETVLDNTFKKLQKNLSKGKRPTSPAVAHQASEPLKPTTDKEKKQQPSKTEKKVVRRKKSEAA